MALDLYAIVGWGVAFDRRHEWPWGGSDDHDADEDELVRLARRLSSFGVDAAAVRGVVVDHHSHFDDRRYFVAIEESLQVGSDLEAVPVSLSVGDDWAERIQAYCRVMDIPCEMPGWFLVTKAV